MFFFLTVCFLPLLGGWLVFGLFALIFGWSGWSLASLGGLAGFDFSNNAVSGSGMPGGGGVMPYMCHTETCLRSGYTFWPSNPRQGIFFRA